MNKLRLLATTAVVVAALTTSALPTRADGPGLPPPFLPPYIVESIAKNGSPAQRAQAQRQLLLDRALLPGGGEGQPAPEARAALLPRGIYSAFNQQILPGTLVWSGPPAPLPADKRV